MEIWLVMFGAGALLLRAGFALQASGSLRAKNAAGSVLRIVVDTAVSALAFWAIGAAILLQKSNGYFGIDSHVIFGRAPGLADREFFYLVILLTAGAVIAGALQERVKFYVGIAAAAVFSGFVIPLVGSWAWGEHGWLRERGFLDAGGATVIHLSAAVCAAIGAIFAGSRNGKYNKDGSSNSIPGHALPLSSVGILLLLVGWFPYILGTVFLHPASSQVQGNAVFGVAAMNVLLAAASASLSGLAFGQFRYRKPDMFFIYSGLLGGLVAISAGAGAMTNIGAVLTGAVAGLLVPLLTLEIDMRWHLDDPLGVIAVHGFGGIWGTLAAALFAPGAFGERMKLLGVQILGIVVIAVVAAVAAAIVFALAKSAGGIRVTDTDEFDGLDLGEHDINGYPDFQQTTIKSYHLREA